MTGPLAGIRVIEFAGLGPAPFCAMMLSDMGAEVLRIDRAGSSADPHDVTARGRASLVLNLKEPADVAIALDLIGRADVLIEGFRPGVMERLGLGPTLAQTRNPRLVYGRMTGWGQDGPLANAAGHDINYIALSGALAAIGPNEGVPIPPLNLLGDYGGGALYLAFGIAAALFERERSGLGQVIDAAVLDGTVSLAAICSWFQARGEPVERGHFLLDGSAHFYRCYTCADGRYVAVGAIEPQFYKLLLDKLEIPESQRPTQSSDDWAKGSELLNDLFRKRTRDEWCAILEGSDACFAPVLETGEMLLHPHIQARSTLVHTFGMTQPAPAPRFSRTPGAIAGAPPTNGAGGLEMADRWRISPKPV